MFTLLKKKWPDIRISIVDLEPVPKYPRFWLIIQPFHDEKPCRLPTRERWFGDYVDVIFSTPKTTKAPPAQVLIARFEMLLILWTVHNLMGGLTADGDVDIYIREVAHEHTVTETIVDERQRVSPDGRVIRLYDEESGLLFLHQMDRHRALIFLTLTHFHCRYVYPAVFFCCEERTAVVVLDVRSDRSLCGATPFSARLVAQHIVTSSTIRTSLQRDDVELRYRPAMILIMIIKKISRYQPYPSRSLERSHQNPSPPLLHRRKEVALLDNPRLPIKQLT